MNRTIAIAVLFGLLGIASVFAGAQGETTAVDTGPIKLTFLTMINVDTEGYEVGDNPYLAYIEEKNNVDIEIISSGTNYAAKLNTIMASGDLPDYVQMPGNRQSLALWANDGVLQPIDEYLETAVNLKRDMNPLSWKLASVNGQIYGVPMERYDASPYLTFVLKDWVDRLGIDPDEVKTIDDWYNLLKAFVEDDPDGNGVKDTLGVITRGDWPDGMYMFLDAFDAAETRLVDGEVLPWYIQSQYKDYLAFWAKLYRDGLMDPEYVVTTKQQFHEKQRSDKAGMFLRFWSLQGYLNRGGKREDVVALRPPLKADGSPSKYLYKGPVRHYIAVTTDCEHPQKVVDIMDWSFTKEGGTFVHAGLEGTDYDLKDGNVVVREDRRGRNWAWRFITLGVQKVKMDDHLQGLLAQSWGPLGIEHLKLSAETGRYDEIAMLAPYFPELADYDLDAIVWEFRDNVVLGKVDIDTAWDDYVARWRKSGGDDWIALHTKWYNEEYKK